MSKNVNRIRSRLGRILSSIFRKEKIFVFEHALTNLCFEAKTKVKVDVSLIKSNDFSEVARARALSEIVKTFKDYRKKANERFKAGHICFGAKLNGEYVHLKWIAFNESYVDEIHRKIRISSDSAYLFNSYTIPNYRGLGISSKVMEKTIQHLSKMGIKKVYALVSHNNFPMLRVKQKERARKIGTITYTKIFKLRLYKFKSETAEDYKKLTEMFSI